MLLLRKQTAQEWAQESEQQVRPLEAATVAVWQLSKGMVQGAKSDS